VKKTVNVENRKSKTNILIKIIIFVRLKSELSVRRDTKEGRECSFDGKIFYFR